MPTTTPLVHHHKHCDDLFARAEQACAEGDWADGAAGFTRLERELESHFQSEEELLFPAFESATGMRSGPTAMMRAEHGQMRELLARMGADLAARDGDAFGGDAETLLILMQQHNMKEENILYPMCDQVLGSGTVGTALRARLEAA
jgi:iron-sulfur cluster repair protein YtfE (RIC family)